MYSQMKTLWQSKILDFLQNQDDSIEVHYRPTRSGSSQTFDSFFKQGTDSTNTNTFSGIDDVEPTPLTITGKIHHALYGFNISNKDNLQQLTTGLFDQSDAVFTCLFSSIDNGDGTTKIDSCYYIYLSTDTGVKYELVSSPKRRGLGESYVYDVFLKRTNR